MNKSNWTIIILGATGDLSRKKLLPALYYLFKHNNKANFIFIGAARDNKIDIKTLFEQSNISASKDDISYTNELLKRSYYYAVDFNNPSDFDKLAKAINSAELEQNMQDNNRLIYLAASAHFYCSITKNLISSGIIKKEDKNSTKHYRVVYEKPFGWDLESAKAINRCIDKLINEEQIYRVDHYLTKALVNSIGLIRFSNILFEPVWNKEYVDHVQIIFSEKVSVEGRGAFYDQYGALKDVVQNHMLQMLSLVAMERPESLDAVSVSKAKCQVLRNTFITHGLKGQYKGYLQEPGVNPLSMTETFAVLKCYIDTARWHNVPFYLKTGKTLVHKSTEIHIVFKQIPKELFLLKGNYDSNVLTIRISPNSGFSLRLNVQKASSPYNVIPMSMDFCYHCFFGHDVPRAYEILLRDVMSGDKSISVSPEEIELAWQIIAQANKLKLNLYRYEQGTQGPHESEVFARKNNITWNI